MRNKRAPVYVISFLCALVCICIILLLTSTNKDDDTEEATSEAIVTNSDNGYNNTGDTFSTANSNINTRNIVDVLIKYTPNSLKIRSLPKHNSDLIGTIENFYTKMYYFGDSEKGYGSDNIVHDWYYIEADPDLRGWVRSDLVISQNANVPYPIGTEYEYEDYIKFTDSTLNIRSEPKHDSDLVGKVTDCNTFIHGCFSDDVGEKSGLGSDGKMHKWVKVVVNSKIEGWARLDLLIEAYAGMGFEGVYVKKTSSSLKVRALPKHKSSLIAEIKHPDTRMYYSGEHEKGLGSDGKMHEWYHVKISETEEGWVRSDYITTAPSLELPPLS